MNAEQLTEMTIDAELWARELLREFSENWNAAAPIVLEDEPQEDVAVEDA